MLSLSVVILTRNEEKRIAACIGSAKLISDDVIVVDSGSNDNTLTISQALEARCFSVDWHGYGFARNFGATKAKYDWILALDADERISEELSQAICQLRFSKINCVYKFRRENYIGNRKIRFGSLGFDTVKRIYNRNHAQWDSSIVHEKLISQSPSDFRFLHGPVLHFGFKNFEEYKSKVSIYARMSAEKYLMEGRKSNVFKRVFSPLFNSFKSYFFQLGFLDGRNGFMIARIIAYYSWSKYFYLQQLAKSSKTVVDPQTAKMEIVPNEFFF